LVLSKKNLAVFISGEGSNLEIFLQNKERFGRVLVVSSTAEAKGLQRAERHGVPSVVLPQPIDWTALQNILSDRAIDVVFLAGFMKIVPASFVEAWSGRLFNLHPSLLPHFKGLRAIDRAYAEGKAIGASIHHVVPAVDAGEVVLQEVAVAASEIPTLSLQQATERTHQTEHALVQRWIDLQSLD
jgi:phosphoribosylglycinamide formyltransferase-1